MSAITWVRGSAWRNAASAPGSGRPGASIQDLGALEHGLDGDGEGLAAQAEGSDAVTQCRLPDRRQALLADVRNAAEELAGDVAHGQLGNLAAVVAPHADLGGQLTGMRALLHELLGHEPRKHGADRAREELAR